VDAPGFLGEIDLISADAVSALGAVDGPCVSVLMPTHRHGPETLQGPVRLRNLVEQAASDLTDAGTPAGDAADLLAPVRALLDDAAFWQHQADGLALFAAPGWFSRFRLPMALVEEVTVGSSFRVVPLIPLLSGDGFFFVLALSQNSVRLFDARSGSHPGIDGRSPRSRGSRASAPGSFRRGRNRPVPRARRRR
jgi:hypothetical protein